MKKVLSVVLALVMVCSLCACGSAKTTAAKSGKKFKKVTFALQSDASVNSGTLVYRVNNESYTVGVPVPAGTSVIGPVIVGANDDVTLGLAAGHENEFEILPD